MPRNCRCGGCPSRPTSALAALLAEPGLASTAIAAPIGRIARDLADMDGVVSVTGNAAAVMTEIGRFPCPTYAGERPAPAIAGATLRGRSTFGASALAVDRPAQGRGPASLQFFGADGSVVHKAFLASLADDYAFAELTNLWSAAPPAMSEACRAAATPADPRLWRVRDLAFHLDSLFGDGGLRRRAALPGWGDDYAWRIKPELAIDLFGLLTGIRAPVLTIVANDAFAQTHGGPFDGMRRAEDRVWLSAGDCTVSLDFAAVEEVWVTRFDVGGRPGLMVELYDWGFQCVAQITEIGADPRLIRFWRRQIEQLPRLARS
ncbi:MAG TPA: ChuX/HutX family heme-like substrate-binding protein [Hansschlegelia sp.]